MLLVGLTGGIGAGKSTVAGLLADRGAIVVDADAAARKVVEPGQPALAKLVERFGPGILAADGSLNRQALADIAFADEAGKQALNEITWPAIGVEMQRQIDAAAPGSVVVCDAALLIESTFGKSRDYGAVIVVEAPLDTRLDRVEQRGVRREDAQRRIALQATDEERRAVATHVIDNSGDVAELAAQVDGVWAELEKRAAERAPE